MNPTIGWHIKPEDAIEDQLDAHVHRLEGVNWITDSHVDDETGEMVDRYGTVRVAQGHLVFGAIDDRRIGTVTPPSAPELDGILRLAAKEIVTHGRKVHERYPGVIHALYGVVRNMPAVTVPSIFEPLDGADRHVGEDGGWVLGGKRLIADPGTMTSPAHPLLGGLGIAQGQMMLHRLATLNDADHTLGNEVRRVARARDLPALVAGVELSLAQTVAYDEVLRRWERTAITHQENQ